jgi:cell division protein FtsN
MKQKKLYPQLRGRIDNLKYGEASWYRLRVAPFGSSEQAQQLCELIRKDMQRCSVVPAN